MADPTLCRRCGRCCAKKMSVDGEVVYLPFYCGFLDVETKLCRVYERRFEANPRCLTVEEGVALGVFPADCPYVAGVAGYSPPRERCTVEELELYREGGEGERGGQG